MKLDCVAISWVTVANAILARAELKEISAERREIRQRTLSEYEEDSTYAGYKRGQGTVGFVIASASTTYLGMSDDDSVGHLPRRKRWVSLGVRGASRLLRPIYMIISVLNVNGAIFMIAQQGHTNPGTQINIHIPGYGSRLVNYYCNDRSLLDPRSKPTIWFESTGQHGVIDFLGLQHHLALDYNFTSCSYDPPNFGWSWTLPAGLEDHGAYLLALIKALGKQDEKRVHIGWAGGLRHAISNAIKDPEHTVAVVDLDASPAGVQYLNLQQQRGWNDTQMLRYREKDIYWQINKMMVMLTLGFGW
jgi:hypothetical protein